MMFTDLPRDLESEILSRVPATSLSQLRSTCKRWHALFKDPRFIRKNLGKAATQVILKTGSHDVYSVSVNHHGVNNSLDPSVELTGNLKSLKDSKQIKISNIFHCDGLLLCTTEDNRPVIWNPCTGQTRWIQSSNGYSLISHEYVLGYNKFCHSCKILRFIYYYNNITTMSLYEFNSDSWRVLYDPIRANFSKKSNGVTLKGNTYWFASNKEDHKFILRFDFTRERFGRRLSLPFQSDYAHENVVLSVVREEKLALLYQNFTHGIDSLEMKIWMTNTKIDEAKDLSWSNFLVVDFSKFIITCMTRVMSFLVDEENKRVVYCDKDYEARTRIYIVGEGIHKQVYQDSAKGSYYLAPHLVSCVPSLVQIQQGKSNPGGKRKK